MCIRLPFMVTFILLCILNSSCSNKCPGATTIPGGTFTSDWTYVNKELGIRIPLPKNWYLRPGGHPWATLIDTAKQIPYAVVRDTQLKEMVQGHEPAPAPMVTLFTLDTEEMHYNTGGTSLDIAFMVAENQSEDGDIRQLKTFVNSLNSDHAETNLKAVTLPVGNGTMKGVSFDLTQEGQYKGTRVILIKNYGCYSLALTATYHSEEQSERINTLLATVNISTTK